MKRQLHSLIEDLAEEPARPGVFNPWRDTDPDHDLGPEAPRIRKKQLLAYLSRRIGHSRLILLAEALGYQGGHFSGIAMTSERILLGHKESEGIPARAVLGREKPRRTSRPEVRPRGFSEPTGTIVWKTLLAAGAVPESFVLWNAFPWHPYLSRRGLLSNRRPNREELRTGNRYLFRFLDLFPQARVVAVGRVSEALLEEAGVEAFPVRHPANGGAGSFRRQMNSLLTQSST